MEIREINRDTCLDLLPVLAELYQYYFPSEPVTEQELEAYLRCQVFSEFSGVRLSAVYLENRVVGFASYTIMYPAPRLSGQMYIKDLFVSSMARGKGLGLVMMKYLARLALEHNCCRLDWTAESTNPSAGAFYRALGASQVTEKEYYRFTGDALQKFAGQSQGSGPS